MTTNHREDGEFGDGATMTTSHTNSAVVGHTPGPWAVEDPMGEDVGLWIVQGGLDAHQWSCIAIITDDEDGTARDEGGRFIGRNEQRANARLIAATPEMLEALKLFRSAIEVLGDGPDDSDEAMAHGMLVQANELAIAAISKATGATNDQQ